MSEQADRDAIMDRVALTCKAKQEEKGVIARAIRFYTGEADCELPWGETMTARQRQLEEAVVAAIAAHYNLNARYARAPFDTARITAARMRISTAAAGPKAGRTGRGRTGGAGRGKRRHP